jgi:hypothetical protein
VLSLLWENCHPCHITKMQRETLVAICLLTWCLRCGRLLIANHRDPLHILKDVVVVFREAFFIMWLVHPSILLIIHPWMASYRKKILTEINNSLRAHVSLSRKGMPGPRGVWYQYQTKRAKYTPVH